MHIIEVGKLYLPNRTEYPEMCEYNFLDSGHELRLFLPDPNKSEIRAVRKGLASFEILVEKNIIFLLYQFKPMPWSDAPFCWWVVPEARRILPETIAEGLGALLQVVLIDANTGIVHAIRVVSLDTGLSQRLHSAILAQINEPISAQEYSDRVDQIYAKYRTTLEMFSDKS